MTPAEEHACHTQLRRLAVLPGHEIDTEFYREYTRAIGSVPIRALEWAVTEAVAGEMFVPTPARLIELIAQAPREPRVATRPALPVAEPPCPEAAETFARENPRGENEPVSAYLHRIAVGAGLMPADAGVRSME